MIMAARGHAGLPPQISLPGGPTPGPMGAPPTAQASPMGLPPRGPVTGTNDRGVVGHAEQQLMAAMAQVHDPALKASFSVALAALHKWLAQDDKEHQQALAGKLSPRLMAQAHGAA